MPPLQTGGTSTASQKDAEGSTHNNQVGSCYTMMDIWYRFFVFILYVVVT